MGTNHEHKLAQESLDYRSFLITDKRKELLLKIDDGSLSILYARNRWLNMKMILDCTSDKILVITSESLISTRQSGSTFTIMSMSGFIHGTLISKGFMLSNYGKSYCEGHTSSLCFETFCCMHVSKPFEYFRTGDNYDVTPCGCKMTLCNPFCCLAIRSRNKFYESNVDVSQLSVTDPLMSDDRRLQELFSFKIMNSN